MQYITAQNNENHQIPIKLYAAQSDQQVIIILPAMGISARFYQPIAQQLSDQGINVVLFEQRGHGHSSIRASRQCDYGFKEYLTQDVHAVVQWVKKHIPSAQINLMGHSLGGHMASCYTGIYPHNIDRVILSACGLPHYTAYQDKKRWQIQFLYHMIPLAHWFYGYFPGHLFKFAGREARSLVNDWRSLIKDHTYTAAGIDHDIDNGIKHYQGAVLSIGFDADTLSPQKGIHMLNNKWSSAELSYKVFTSKELQFPADHFKWVRQPEQVSQLIKSWINCDASKKCSNIKSSPTN